MASGMFKNSENYMAAVAGFSVLFQDGLEGAGGLWPRIAMRVPSNSDTENYDWIGDLPLVREWTCDRVLKTLVAQHMSLVNKEYENSITIKRTNIEDDKLGMLMLKIRMMGAQHAKKKDALVFDFLTAGAFSAANAGYDGVSLINANHPNEVGGTQTNTAGAAALASAAYEAAIEQMELLTDDYGDPLGIRPNLLVTGPQNRQAAKEIVKQERLASGESNTNYGTTEMLISPRITGTHWFLIDTSQMVMPVVMQDRLAPEMEDPSLASAESLFMRGEYRYGGRMRMAVGAGLWQTIYGNVGA